MHFGARFGLTPYFFLGGAAPEVISGQLYAGAEVDIWSCEYLYNISLSIYIYISQNMYLRYKLYGGAEVYTYIDILDILSCEYLSKSC